LIRTANRHFVCSETAEQAIKTPWSKFLIVQKTSEETMSSARVLLAAILAASPTLAAAQPKVQTPVDVTVVNKLAQPVPVVDRSTADPVTGYCQAGLSQLGCTLFTVPTGKRLVVETVSYFLTISAQNQVTRLSFGKKWDDPLSVAPGLFAVNPTLQYTEADFKRYAGSQALRFYIDQGQTLNAQFGSNGGQNYVQEVSFSGYLVDR
jgi:hypothetical protein